MNQNKDYWECPKCKISIEPHFDTCWKCSFGNSLEDEKKIDEIKKSGLSEKYQSLRLFQNLIWAGFGFSCILLIPGSLVGLVQNYSLSTSTIFLILVLSGIYLIIAYYCTKMFSKMIDFLFDLDQKNNK